MTNIAGRAWFLIKLGEAIVNLIVLVLYRVGNGPHILDIDMETLASGVIVGFFSYTGAWLVSYCFERDNRKNTLIDIILSFVGVFLWLALGIIVLQNWIGISSYGNWHGRSYGDFTKRNKYGQAIGGLCIILAIVYLSDTILCGFRLAKEKLQN